MYALALTGPTASGKTAISLKLANMLDAEIICLDSMQIYKEMDIGTAKPTEEERCAVPHHLVDFLPFSENYNAEGYKADALLAAEDIITRGRLPLFVGGTGLYADTLMSRGANEAPESDREYINSRLSEIKNENDVRGLWERLFEVDPKSAAAIHQNNVKRVLRALEIYEKTGKTKTYFDEASKQGEPAIKIGMITLDFHNRELLYKRVNERVDAMVRAGLIEEVKALKERGLFDGDYTAAQAIGYKEIGEYLSGKVTKDEAIEALKLSTRRYAKRQITWFKHVSDAYRLYMDDGDGVLKGEDELISEAARAAKNLLTKIK